MGHLFLGRSVSQSSFPTNRGRPCPKNPGRRRLAGIAGGVSQHKMLWITMIPKQFPPGWAWGGVSSSGVLLLGCSPTSRGRVRHAIMASRVASLQVAC